MKFRYSRWDGSQEADLIDADDVLDALADDLMAGGDLAAAIQRLHRWGMPGVQGLEGMLGRLRELREQQLARYNLDSSVEQLRREVQEIIDNERGGIDRKLEGAPPGRARNLLDKVAARRRRQLDRLPDDLGGRVKGLREYEFMDPEAEARFREVLERLQQQVMAQMFEGLKSGIQSLTQRDLSRVRNMVRELNQMLEDRARGLTLDFQGFMERHGDMLPAGLHGLDDLLDHLRRQMAQMESLLRSLSPQARQELGQLLDDVLQDDSLRLDLARMGQLLQGSMPGQMVERYPFFGDDPLSLQEAMGLMDRLQGMDELEAQLERSYRLDEVDTRRLEDLLGPQARADLDRLRQLQEVLKEAGYLERRGRRLELTPRGMRRIGQSALRDVFEHLRKARLGQHRLTTSGIGVEAGDELKPYEYGDPFFIDLRETLFEALHKEGKGVPIRISPDGFVVRRTEHSTQASTVLMIDMSRSMFLRGCFLAAKKMAIALDALIRSQFPRDRLYLVGFSNHAVLLRPQTLPQISLSDYVYGTNMQHGLQLARSLLARHRGNRQVIMVTDGEPTAHLEGGHVYFAYPPTPRTLQETLREVRNCTSDRITINTFMLERGPHLTEFVNQLTRINRGRAFFVSPEHLGEYVLVDYVSGRARRTSRAS